MKRILIDVEKCYKCSECVAECSYFYHRGSVLKEPIKNKGVEKFLVYALQLIICRRCEEKFCVNSCPNEALWVDDKGILQRSSMLCTSCKNCSVGCPFGTIYPEVLPYKTSKCDFCIGREDEVPLCVRTCPHKALEYRDVEEDASKNIYVINNRVAIKAIKWIREAKVK
jgi:Fe-S-cluster-containing dehydrogenase component